MAVHSSPALYLEALRIADRHRLSWDDSLIVAAALQAGCGVLYTEDLKRGQEIEGMRVQSPFV